MYLLTYLSTITSTVHSHTGLLLERKKSSKEELDSATEDCVLRLRQTTQQIFTNT